MPSSTMLAFVNLLALIPAVSAWGQLGHDTVAYVAQDFLKPATATWAKKILNDTSANYLANVATWADTYRYTTAGKWSAPFHFIDAHDDPPTSCGVDYARDCGLGGCVVSAIQNYVRGFSRNCTRSCCALADMSQTSRVKDKHLSAAEHRTALEFLVHFLGDITQPLHDEAHEVGGNGIAVTFDGTKTNLHHIWDTNMLEKLVGGYTLPYSRAWATNLTIAIKDGGMYAHQRSGWVKGANLSDPVGSAMGWAVDANAFVCTAALPDGDSAVEGVDLAGEYYDNAVPVFTEQIAKGKSDGSLDVWHANVLQADTDLQHG